MPIKINKLLKQIQDAQAEANRVNKERYELGLAKLEGAESSLKDLYRQAGERMGTIGAAAREDVRQGARAQAAGLQQQLISSGLANTTISGTMMRGVESDRLRAMQGLQEQDAARQVGLMTQQAGAQMGAAGGVADFIAARSDVGPNVGMYSDLIRAAMANQAPAGSGMGGGSTLAGGTSSGGVMNRTWSPNLINAMAGRGGSGSGGGSSTAAMTPMPTTGMGGAGMPSAQGVESRRMGDLLSPAMQKAQSDAAWAETMKGASFVGAAPNPAKDPNWWKKSPGYKPAWIKQ